MQNLFKIFDPNSVVLPNMMHFVRTFSINRASGVRVTAVEEVRNYGKNCIHRKHF